MTTEAAARASGYVTDLPYVVRYQRELNPSVFRLCLAMQGIDWNKDENCDYIELGCGFGLSTLFHAAGHPDARFTAIDLNPEHIDTARGIAASAKLGNVDFQEGAFADLNTPALQGRMPAAFDVIAMHGVWSWINDENRGHILRFIDRCLKPGGLLYVSYNTLPGLASTMALRELMMLGADAAATTDARVQAGVAFAEQVRGLDAAFFKTHPRAGLAFDNLKTKSPNALAHEYFNRDWRIFYHAEVADPLARLGLKYAASAHVIDNIDHINYGREARHFLAAQPLERRESVKDFLASREFRRDIYIRGDVPRGDGRALLAGQRFIAWPGALDSLHAGTPLGKISIGPEQAAPVLSVLQARPASPKELLADPACAGLKPGDVMDTVMLLAAFNNADLALPETDQRRQAALRLNAVLWEAAKTVDVIHFNVSPLTSGGLAVQRIEQLFLLARHLGQEAGPFLRALFGPNVQGDIAANARQFAANRLPDLQKYGITQ